MPGGGFAPANDFNEKKPAGTDYGYLLDDWIISNTKHLCNAYAIEHYEMSNDPDASEDDFGRHDYITLKEQALKPDLSGSTDRTGFYTKADGVYIEKDDATEIQILDFTTDRSGVDNDVPSGEIILFEKDTAVTGYTLQTDKDDMLVYITKGSVAGGETGGTDYTGGTWTVGGLTTSIATHAITVAEMPAHTHTIPGAFNLDAAADYFRNCGITSINNGTTSSTGSGDAHGHAGSTVSQDGTWRPSGRNFTRQARN